MSASSQTPSAWMGPVTRRISATASGSAAITPSIRSPVVCSYSSAMIVPTVGMSGGMLTAVQSLPIANRS